MRRIISHAVCLFALSTALLRAESGAELFNSAVWPVLEARCIKCHGSEKVKGALRLDSREAALKGGENGPAIVPGKPQQSLLIKMLHPNDDGKTMPPKEKLTDAEIKTLEKWIASGAEWPARNVAAPVALKPGERLGDAWSDPRNPILRIFKGQRLDMWSLKPLAKVRPDPAVPHPIDALIRLKSETAKAPVPEADRRTLLRRVYIDVIGLPPSPEETEAFLADKAPDSYSRLVDRLLASSKYGEHWARMWLDAVRYSDSNGFDWDEFRPQAWRFRDYVIRSLNADKPYDQFIREQLAGDEMVAGEPENAAQQDALIATGYLRLGPMDNSAGAFAEQEKVRQQVLNDLVETTGGAMLGLTMSCCRCHDHKTDPISQEDYYRLKAFFEPMKFRDDLPLDFSAEQKAIRGYNAKIESKMELQKIRKAEVLAVVKLRLRAERRAKLPAESAALLETPNEQRDDSIKTKVKELEKKLEVSDEEAKKALNAGQKKELAAIDEALKKIKKELRSFTTALCASDGDATKPTKVLFQGNLSEPRQEVVAGYPSILDPNPAALRKSARVGCSGRRSTLADWITSPSNPLAARVMVNRVWQGFFGTGLVATPNDFGLAGAKPANLELLDWLASEFVREGWSLKKLHRLILTSAAYRQTTRAGSPPLGQAPRRLSAEQLRDAMLLTGGLLQESSGGPPVWPALPAEVLKANPAFLDDNETKTKGWYPSPADKQNVRSIYLVQKRTVRVTFMETFDLPDNSVSCPKRNNSTVAPQALTLLNNNFTIDCARAFASRIEREAGMEKQAQVRRAFRVALQREPDAEEQRACEKFRESRTLVELCRAMLNLNEFIYRD